MAKKYYAQKLFDFLRPSNPSTDGTFRFRATKFFDNVFRRSQTNRDATAVPNDFQRFQELPTELRGKIIQSAIPNAALRQVNHEFNGVVRRNETLLWGQAKDRADKAVISDYNIVISALSDCGLAPENINVDARRLFLEPHERPEKVAEAFVNILNNSESGERARGQAFRGLGAILEYEKLDHPQAARIAAWGLWELANSPPRPTDNPKFRDEARRFLRSLTGNELACIKSLYQKTAQPPPSSPERRPTTQILFSALKRPAKTWKLVQDMRHRGRSGGGRV
jgi:hypothetical protein